MMASLFATMSVAQAGMSRLSQPDGMAARAVARLSSGLRVQQAADDPAGLAISERMSATIRAHGVIGRGLNDAIGQVQQADLGLERISETLQRARELALESGNGTLGDADRANLQQEYQALLAQVDAIADGARLFGTSLLQSPRASGHTPYLSEAFSALDQGVAMSSGIRPIAYIPAGMRNVRLEIDALGADDDIQVFTTQGQQLLGTGPGDSGWRANGIEDAQTLTRAVMQPDLGFADGATYDDSVLLDGRTGFADPLLVTSNALPMVSQFAGMTLSYSGDGDQHDGGVNDGRVSDSYRYEAMTIDETTQPLLVMVVGSGSFIAQASWIEAEDGSTLVSSGARGSEVVLQADSGSAPTMLSLDHLPSDSAALGLTGSGIGTQDGAQASLALIDRAIDRVGGHRGRLGASASRLERTLEQLGDADEAARSARSRIVDADIAAELSDRMRHQVQTEAARTLLGQAQLMPRMVLGLLLPDR